MRASNEVSRITNAEYIDGGREAHMDAVSNSVVSMASKTMTCVKKYKSQAFVENSGGPGR